MTTRRVLLAGAILAVVSLVIILFRDDGSSPSTEKVISSALPAIVPVKSEEVNSRSSAAVALPSPVSGGRLEGRSALVAPQPDELATQNRSPLADGLDARNTKPETEPLIVLDLLNAYRRYFNAYPAGESNRQFVNALLGNNKAKMPFIPLDHSRINTRGELVDAWGTPFFFHQNSRDSVQVRGAGPDKTLFTADDFIAGKAPPPMLTLPAAASK